MQKLGRPVTSGALAAQLMAALGLPAGQCRAFRLITAGGDVARIEVEYYVTDERAEAMKSVVRLYNLALRDERVKCDPAESYTKVYGSPPNHRVITGAPKA